MSELEIPVGSAALGTQHQFVYCGVLVLIREDFLNFWSVFGLLASWGYALYSNFLLFLELSLTPQHAILDIYNIARSSVLSAPSGPTVCKPAVIRGSALPPPLFLL